MYIKQKITAIVPIGLVLVISILFALFPHGSIHAATTSISSTIAAVISLQTTSGTVAVNVTPTASGVQTINKDIVTVSTNDSAGYTLKLGETTVTTGLVSGGNTIPASTGTQAVPIVQAVNTWGYRVDGIGGFGATATTVTTNAAISGSIKFAAIPATASPDTIKTTATTATSDVTNVWYGVAANTTVPSGSYTNSVTYTVVAN